MEKKLSINYPLRPIIWIQYWWIAQSSTFEKRGNPKFEFKQGCAKILIPWNVRNQKSKTKWNRKWAYYWEDFAKEQS